MLLPWSSLYQAVNLVFQIYIFIVVARALISWVGPDPYNPIVRFLCRATDPVLDRLRRLLPLQFGGIDLTPVALLLGLYLAKDLLLNLIVQLARG
ncbi:MAG: YggT family protein [Deltaproteobacteria bacterium]|nr:MAG: YggT family protein [Deltaproteobacteria bacterium]